MGYDLRWRRMRADRGATEGAEMRRSVFGVLAPLAAIVLAGLPARGGDVRGPATFERDVEPILTRAGCNAGACHGKARGQNGFPLSLLGFDPEFDLDAITREARGRRVFPANPAQSLILLKGSAQIPHGGGRRLEIGGDAYETILLWIEQGMPRSPADSPAVERVSIEPAER